MISKFNWKQSDLLAQLNYAKKQGWFLFFKEASTRYAIPLSLLLAIASRETNIRNIKGADGHGTGIMQIDDRYHKEFIRDNKEGFDPKGNILYGAEFLRSNIDRVAKELGTTNYDVILKPAISGYNGSLEKVIKLAKQDKDTDSVTTKKNYAADVLARREIFDKFLNEGK